MLIKLNYSNFYVCEDEVTLLTDIKSRIDSHQIISFDIFDTLLLRPYVKPTDLFLHMEKVYKIPFFCYLRQEAEKNAKINHQGIEDITLDMIYAEIDDKFKSFKQKELDWEEMVLRANPELLEVYNYAKSQGKKIIIASDMYLPTDFIAKVLNKNGFYDWDKLYVSGDLIKGKYSGSMYRHILDDSKTVDAQDVLHIGDNKKSDYQKAKELGLDAILYQSVLKQFLKDNPKIKSYKQQSSESIGKSILLGFLSYEWQKARFDNTHTNNYWFKLGYNYAGPLAYGYARFFEEQAIKSELNNIFFVARDGWLLQQVFNSFNNKVKSSYVYAPRILNLICRLDYNRNNIQQSKAIIENFAKINIHIKQLLQEASLKKAKDYHKFIQNNIELFKNEANKLFDNYKSYLSSHASKKDKIGLADTITCEFSSQKLVQNTIPNQVLGMYWGVLPSQIQNVFEYSTFTQSKNEKQDNKSIYTENWNFVEFLLSSPEFPIKNISKDGKPIYEEAPDDNEIWRSNTYPQIADGALKFAKDINDIFGGNNIYLSAQDLISWVNEFVSNPEKEDHKYFANVSCAVDSNHKEYVPLFACNVTLKEFVQSPKKAIKKLKKTLWRNSLQSYLINIFHPISFRSRGLKKMQLAMFPSLRKQYFTVALTISRNCFYKFIIGNPKV